MADIILYTDAMMAIGVEKSVSCDDTTPLSLPWLTLFYTDAMMAIGVEKSVSCDDTHNGGRVGRCRELCGSVIPRSF